MNDRANTVGIVGAGPFGVALAHVVTQRGGAALLWTRAGDVVTEINETHRCESRLPGVTLPASVRATADPHELARRARFLVLAVSSADARARLRILGDAVDGGHLVVHAIGGLAGPDDARVSEVVREETPVLRVGALAGPALPRDLARGRAASMVCASELDEVTAEARRLLNAPPALRVYRSRDFAGVELAAALAGAYTIVLAIADELEVGIGTRAVLLTRAIAEMGRLVVALGGEERSVSGLAGLGNLLVRSASGEEQGSPSYRYGRDLVRGVATGARVVEGARAALAGARLADRRGLRAPLLAGLVQVIEGRASAADAAQAILAHVADEE